MSKLSKTQELASIGDTLEVPLKIYANQNNFHTGVILSAERKYNFMISSINEWHDAAIKNVNPQTGWHPENQENLNRTLKIMFNIGKQFTYIPQAGYMELIGEVNGELFRLGNIAKDYSDQSSQAESYQPKNTGELIVRANEPKLFFNKRYYSNNSGILDLQILAVE